MTSRLLRVAAGHAWLLAWMVVLWGVAAPWRELGGIESEYLRWLEIWVLGGGLVSGFLVGRRLRERAGGLPGLRLALYPPAAITAAVLVALAWGGARGPIGVVTTAWLAYGAGFDLAFGALALMEGKPLARPRSTFSVAPETGSAAMEPSGTQRRSDEEQRPDGVAV